MRQLISRNLKLYFRDRMAVFYSLLSILISIALYVLFLAGTMMNGDLGEISGMDTVLNLWLLGGLLSMGAVTTTLAGYETMVADRMDHREKDFLVSSMPRYRLAMSYIVAAILIGMIMVSVTLIVALAFFFVSDGLTLDEMQIMQTLLISFVNVVASALIFFPIIQMLKTRSSFGNLSMLMGTLVGFLMGVYVPIGALPDFAQMLIKCFPITHGCAMLRSLFTHVPLSDAIAMGDIVAQVEEELGITLSFGDHVMSGSEHMLVLSAVIVIFALLSLWCYRRRRT